ncbi:MAG: hypothetical protein M9931_05355 [Chitinophagales bacterium]|nr:hypothetical protein [Chitinophagales bacterium]
MQQDILTASDVNGNATWKDPAKPWESMGSDIRQACNNGLADVTTSKILQ